MNFLQRISTVVLAALLSLAALLGLIGVGRAQDAPMAPEIAASISGTVYNAAGQPLADIEVTALRNGSWPAADTTRTDASGAYTLRYLTTGIYRLGFRDTQERYLPLYHPNADDIAEAQDIAVAGMDVTGLQTFLQPAMRITGSVHDDTGEPLPEIVISVFQQNEYGGWSTVRTTRTDASGAYTLSYLYPGTYRLELLDPRGQYIPRFHPDAQVVEDATDIVVQEVDVTGLRTNLQPTAQLGGEVSLLDGVQPLEAAVTVYAPDGEGWKSVKQNWFSGQTQPVRYQIVGLLPGRYRIGAVVTRWNGYSWSRYEEFYNDVVDIQDAEDVILGSGDVLTDVHFVLGKGGHLSNLSGTVTTPERIGLPGILVTAYISKTQHWQEMRQTVTITDGVYTLNGLPAGIYAVHFQDPLRKFVGEYYDDVAAIDTATILSVTEGSDLTGVDAELRRTGGIVAEISMYDGQMPRYAEVRAYSASSGYSEVIASQSMYGSIGQAVSITLPNLLPGTYRLQITAQDQTNTYSEYYDDALTLENAADVLVSSGEMTEVRAVLGQNPSYAQITGTVQSSELTPLPNIKVTAFYQDYPDAYYWTPQQSTYTDQDGNYALHALLPNTYTVKFDSPDGAYLPLYYANAMQNQNATRLRLEGGEKVININAILTQTGMITGTVTQYDGRPPTSGYATLYRLDVNSRWSRVGEPIFLGGATSRASYRFTGLPTGNYRVGVSAGFGNGWYGEMFYPSSWDIFGAQDIYVEEGVTTPSINFVFGEDTYDASIAGQVYADGSALQGIQVDLYVQSASRIWQRLVFVYTDDSGAFRIDGLRAGAYRICVVDPGAVRDTVCLSGADDVDGASTIEVGNGEVIRNLHIDMVRFGHWSYLPIIGR